MKNYRKFAGKSVNDYNTLGDKGDIWGAETGYSLNNTLPSKRKRARGFLESPRSVSPKTTHGENDLPRPTNLEEAEIRNLRLRWPPRANHWKSIVGPIAK